MEKKDKKIIKKTVPFFVLLILIVVLIPITINVVKKINHDKDVKLVANINDYYVSERTKKSDTMYQALNVIKNNGYQLKDIQDNSAGDYFIAWDRINDRFVLVDESTDTYMDGNKEVHIDNKYDFFRVYDEMPEEQDYSIYLSNKNVIGDITNLEVGFDAGDNKSVNNLTYDRRSKTNKQDIYIRTNKGTKAFIYGYDDGMAEGDKIYHYGEASQIEEESASGSFYECGGSAYTIVNKGHYVQNSGTIVSYLEASASEGDVVIDLKDHSIQGTVINNNKYHSVEINAESKAETINVEAYFLGGGVTINYVSKPLYSNVSDQNELIDNKPFIINGIGNQGSKEKELPSYSDTCEIDGEGHIFKTLSGYSVEICEKCGSYKNNEQSYNQDEEVIENDYLYKHEDEGFIKTVVHEHHYSSPSWYWTSYTSTVARFVCDDNDCNDHVDVYTDDIEELVITKEDCVTNGEYEYKATIEFNNNIYSNISPNRRHVDALNHILVHHEGHQATCLEDGWDEYDECIREGCNYNTKQITPAYGHQPGTPVEENRIEATCTQDGSYDLVTYCSRDNEEISREHIIIPALGHDDNNPCGRCGESTTGIKLENADKYRYKVGNKNAIPENYLFARIPEIFEPVFETVKGDATGSLVDKSFYFSGRGIVKISVEALVLELEVIDALNVFNATSAISEDIVFLNNINGQFNITNGHTLYGNGFTCKVTHDSGAYGLTSGFIEIENGILDNIQLICPTMTMSILYSTQFSSADVDYVSGNNRSYYFDIRSAVTLKGNSVISNSYISGGRSAVQVVNGYAEIINTTLDGGSVANLIIEPAVNQVVLDDLTTIQLPRQSTRKADKTVIGLGILVIVSGANTSAEIVLNNKLRQYNWVNTSYSPYIPFEASMFINPILNKDKYVHMIDGVKNINTGLLFLNSEGSYIDSPIERLIDNRVDKDEIKYDIERVASPAFVYSYVSENGTSSELINYPTYKPNINMTTPPILNIVDYDVEAISFTKVFITNYWQHKLVAKKESQFSFRQIKIQKNGQDLEFVIKDKDGNVIDQDTVLLLNDINMYNYVITTTYENQLYEYKLVIYSSVGDIDSPTLIISNYEDAIYLKNKKDWQIAVPALEGLVIRYYSASNKDYVNLDLSTLTPKEPGKQNGSNNMWVNETIDYKLVIISNGFHERNNDNGIPVVYNDKLYFCPASMKGFVSNNTTGRDATLTYYFTVNDETLSFSHRWSRAMDLTGIEYSSFLNE